MALLAKSLSIPDDPLRLPRNLTSRWRPPLASLAWPTHGPTSWGFRLDFPEACPVGCANASPPQLSPVTGGDSSDPHRGARVLLSFLLQPNRARLHSPSGPLTPGGLSCLCRSGGAWGSSKKFRTTTQGDQSGNVRQPLTVSQQGSSSVSRSKGDTQRDNRA